MYSRIVQVYQRGVRRPERDLANDPGHLGDLLLLHSQGHTRLSFTEHGNTRGDSRMLPSLHEVQCVGLQGEHMLFRGFQKSPVKNAIGEAPVYIQEWRVRILQGAGAA